jgi:plasmid replication initiation protein
MALGSSYAITIYKLLKRDEFMTKKTIVWTVAELREQLGLSVTDYTLYTNFKNRVLETAKQHINENTDICFEYIEHKQSRKVHSIEFKIRKNQTQKEQLAKEFYNRYCENQPRLAELFELARTKRAMSITDFEFFTSYWERLRSTVEDYQPDSFRPLKFYKPDELFS